MSAVAPRDARRELLIARIADNRAALQLSLHELQQPVRRLEQWQGGLLRFLPLLPGVLAVAALAWVLLRLLRRAGPGPGPLPARQGGWSLPLQQLLSAIRFAMQCYALLQVVPPAARPTLP
jgi:hypothetical protein